MRARIKHDSYSPSLRTALYVRYPSGCRGQAGRGSHLEVRAGYTLYQDCEKELVAMSKAETIVTSIDKEDKKHMRAEIEEQIKNSGTADDAQVIKDYRNASKKIGTPFSEIEKVIQNKDNIQMLKYRIVLDNQNIQDSEIKKIAQMIIEEKPETRQLSLAGNQISDDGAVELANLLQNLKKLSFLNLQDNKIDENGFRALFELKLQNPQLNLGLRGNKLSDAGVADDLKKEVERNSKMKKA